MSLTPEELKKEKELKAQLKELKAKKKAAALDVVHSCRIHLGKPRDGAEPGSCQPLKVGDRVYYSRLSGGRYGNGHGTVVKLTPARVYIKPDNGIEGYSEYNFKSPNTGELYHYNLTHLETQIEWEEENQKAVDQANATKFTTMIADLTENPFHLDHRITRILAIVLSKEGVYPLRDYAKSWLRNSSEKEGTENT